MVIEAWLAVESRAIFGDKKRNRATVLAFKVSELVTVKITNFFAISELFLSTRLAQQILGIHALTFLPRFVQHSSIKNGATMVAMV